MSMLEFKRHIINPPLWPSVQVTKLPTTFFMFLRVPLTQLDRWQAFFTKFPRNYRCSQTINAPHEDFGIQAVADGNMLFLGFSAGCSGSMHDALILQNSILYQRAERGGILTGPVVDLDGHEVGPYLLGDSAYLISLWLQKPFPEATREWSEIQFNCELSSARVKVECTFGCLKSWWRI